MAMEREDPFNSSELANLLYKALESLPEGERKVLTQALFAAGLLGAISRSSLWEEQRSAGQAPFPAFPMGWRLEAMRDVNINRRDQMRELVLKAWRAPAVDLGADQQIVPVRFSKEQYDRFKSWCDENGFSMAVVIRGLLEQFLGDQGKRAS